MRHADRAQTRDRGDGHAERFRERCSIEQRRRVRVCIERSKDSRFDQLFELLWSEETDGDAVV